MAAPLVALLVGCALRGQAVGLLLPDSEPVSLRTADGRTFTLVLEGEATPVRYLHDCVVAVEGPRLGREIRVQDWHVLDAGDGTGGFVGVLIPYGNRVMLEDRNTGTTLLLDDVAAAQLRPYLGQSVLLMGYITGGNTISPMAWRVLAPD